MPNYYIYIFSYVKQIFHILSIFSLFPIFNYFESAFDLNNPSLLQELLQVNKTGPASVGDKPLTLLYRHYFLSQFLIYLLSASPPQVKTKRCKQEPVP